MILRRPLALLSLSLLAIPLACDDPELSNECEGPGCVDPQGGGGKADIYGQDDRVDPWEVANEPVYQKAARAAAVLFWDDALTAGDEPGTYQVSDMTFGEAYWDLCPEENFIDQPVPGGCSAFLVHPELVVTAGHCLTESQTSCEGMNFVFDFGYFEDPGDDLLSVTTIAEENIYSCKTVLAYELDETSDIDSRHVGPDYAVLLLDRPVTDREPLDVRRDSVALVDPPVFAAAFPSGLPLKISTVGAIAQNFPHFFTDSTDSFPGSSGGAIVNASTGTVEGIVSRGPQDFEWDEEDQCLRSKVCEEVDDDRGEWVCTGNESTYVRYASEFVPQRPMEASSVTLGEASAEVAEEYNDYFAGDYPYHYEVTLQWGGELGPRMVKLSPPALSTEIALVVPHEESRAILVDEAVEIPLREEGLWISNYSLRAAGVEFPTESFDFVSSLGPLPTEMNLVISTTEPLSADELTWGVEALPTEPRPQVYFSEIMARYQAGNDDPGEYIELYNGGDETDLGGCVLYRDELEFYFPAGTRVGAGEYLLLTSSPGGDADLSNALVLPFALLNTGGELTLHCRGMATDWVEYSQRHVELGVSWQKDVNFLTEANDLDVNWCATPTEAAHQYTEGSADGEPKYGTPGEANLPCD